MKFGCDFKILCDTSRILSEEEYSKAIKRMCECGFSYYNFDFVAKDKNSPICADNYIDWAKGLREALDENEAHCVIAHEPCFFKFKLTDEQSEIQRRMIETSEIIGIEQIVMHPIDEDGSGDSAHMRRLFDGNYEYFSKYSDLLEKHNVGMAIEVLSNVFKLHYNGLKRQFGDNPYELIELVDKIDSNRIGLCLDVGHLNTMGIFHIGDTVKAMGKRLKALHIHDNNGILDQHYLPFMGSIDWSDFIHALKEIGYEGYFTYEADTLPMKYPEELRPSWLRLMWDIAEYITDMD